ncbi:MAG TPA: hypothetical protein VNB90_16470 [Cytophagaceae bacterium]|nr:hypothetical protein [Cytophagaceae bacterium]
MKTILYLLLIAISFSACSKSSQKSSAKCGTRQARKKVAYYLSIPHQ